LNTIRRLTLEIWAEALKSEIRSPGGHYGFQALWQEKLPSQCCVDGFGGRRAANRRRSGPYGYGSSRSATKHARPRPARPTRGSRGTWRHKDHHAHDLLHTAGG